MKKRICFLLAFFIALTVYADATYTVISKGNPAEIVLQAYKNSPDLSEDESIDIFNYVNDTQEKVYDPEENRFTISDDKYLNGEKLFDIVYRTNSFERHIDFSVDISMFVLDEGENTNMKIDVIPEIALKYEFSAPSRPEYISLDQDETPDYGSDDDISKESFKNKYSSRLEENFKITKKNNDSGTSFSFKCYPEDKERIKIIQEQRGLWGSKYNMTYYADVTFTASASVNLPSGFNPNDYNGRYVMSVNIKAVISGS